MLIHSSSYDPRPQEERNVPPSWTIGHALDGQQVDLELQPTVVCGGGGSGKSEVLDSAAVSLWRDSDVNLVVLGRPDSFPAFASLDPWNDERVLTRAGDLSTDPRRWHQVLTSLASGLEKSRDRHPLATAVLIDDVDVLARDSEQAALAVEKIARMHRHTKVIPVCSFAHSYGPPPDVPVLPILRGVSTGVLLPVSEEEHRRHFSSKAPSLEELGVVFDLLERRGMTEVDLERESREVEERARRRDPWRGLEKGEASLALGSGQHLKVVRVRAQQTAGAR